VRVAGTYSFKSGREAVKRGYPQLLREIYSVIEATNEEEHKTKESKEKTMPGQMLYSPTSLNRAFKRAFKLVSGWRPIRVACDYWDVDVDAETIDHEAMIVNARTISDFEIWLVWDCRRKE
jgi:hypothetical protein